MDIDGEVEDKPIANSLKELINNMNVIMWLFYCNYIYMIF